MKFEHIDKFGKYVVNGQLCIESGLMLLYKINVRLFFISQVNDINFENMSNDDAVRVLREIVHKPG